MTGEGLQRRTFLGAAAAAAIGVTAGCSTDGAAQPRPAASKAVVMTAPGQVIEGNPIINSPFIEPSRYWHFGGVVPEIRSGRRTAGYLAPSPDGQLRKAPWIV